MLPSLLHQRASRLRSGLVGTEQHKNTRARDSNRNVVERQANLPPVPFSSAPGLPQFAQTELMVSEPIYREAIYAEAANQASRPGDVTDDSRAPPPRPRDPY